MRGAHALRVHPPQRVGQRGVGVGLQDEVGDDLGARRDGVSQPRDHLRMAALAAHERVVARGLVRVDGDVQQRRARLDEALHVGRVREEQAVRLHLDRRIAELPRGPHEAEQIAADGRLSARQRDGVEARVPPRAEFAHDLLRRQRPRAHRGRDRAVVASEVAVVAEDDVEQRHAEAQRSSASR